MNIQLSDHFTIPQTDSLYNINSSYAYLYVDVQYCRRTFCVKLCRENAICGDKSDLAGIYGNRSNRIYARNRRKRIVAKNAWGR